MSGSKPFGSGEDYPSRSSIAGKPILLFNPETPIRFVDLIDTIANYTGHAGKFLVINATETGVEVSTASTIVDAIALLVSTVNGISAILDADPIKFGADLDMEQYQIKKLRLDQLAADPVSPVNGQVWYNTVTKIAKIYQNDAVQPFFSAADALLLLSLSGDISTLQDDVNAAEVLIGNISDDGLLSMSEKPVIHLEYDKIIAEQSGIDSDATAHSVTTEKTTYDDAITALTNYITGLDPAYDDYTADTTIVRATFNTKFLDVYTAKQALLNKISSNTFTELQLISDEADDAVAAAAAAEVNAALALQGLSNISADGWLSKAEKQTIILDYSVITTEQTGIDAEAVEHGVTTEKTNYDTAITDLTTYLGTLSPAWNDTANDTEITRLDFNTAWADVYETRQILLNAIARAALDVAAQALADAATADGKAVDAQAAADAAQGDATEAKNNALLALGEIDNISNDEILSKSEKPAIILQVETILSEQVLLDAQAVIYSITTEKDDYDDAITALSAYLGGLPQQWDDTSVNTAIVPATFRSKFQDVYDTRTALYLLIYDKAVDSAVATAFTQADDAHAARTKLLIDGGFVSAGRFEVGDQAYGDNNAGMSGLITGTPTTDIRFWAGSNATDRNTAPWRVQHDGTMYATKAVIGGWTVETDAIYKGTKHTDPGFAHNVGDITLSADGSIHAKNFYINADGTVSFSATTPVIDGVITTIVPIGVWDMNATASVSVAHGLTTSKIRMVDAYIRGDDAVTRVLLPIDYVDFADGLVNGSAYMFGINIVLTRRTGGHFDSTDFDSIYDSNRGWIVITHDE